MMSFIGQIVLVVAVIAVVLYLINRGTLKKVWGAGRAQVGKLGGFAERADPLALINQAVEDGVEKIQLAKKGLEAAKMQVLKSQRRSNDLTAEKARLESRIETLIREGQEGRATEYALQLADAEKKLEDETKHLQAYTTNYDAFARQVQVGQKKVEDARHQAQDLGVELQQSKSEAEMAAFVESCNFSSSGLDDGLSHAQQLVQDQIDKNRAKGIVAQDMNKAAMAQIEDEELERKAKASDILARFKKPSAS
jgi:phage shock protein A